MTMQQAFETAAPQWVSAAWDYVERNPAVEEMWMAIAFEAGEAAVGVLYKTGTDVLDLQQVGDLGVDASAEAQRELRDGLRATANEFEHKSQGTELPSAIFLRFDAQREALDADFSYDDLQEDADPRLSAEQWVAHWVVDEQDRAQAEVSFDDAFREAVPELVACAWDYIDRDERVSALTLVLTQRDGEYAGVPVYTVDDELVATRDLDRLGFDFDEAAEYDVRTELADLTRGLVAAVADKSEVPTLMVVSFVVETSEMEASFSDEEQPGVAEGEELSVPELAEAWADAIIEMADAEDDQ